MLYSFLTILVRIALKIFFRKIHIHGKENIPAKGPIIVIGNHPNTFMDPILAALIMLPKQVHFLANGSIFKTAIARLVLAQLHTIPVYRIKDETDNREQRNENAFQKCFEFLTTGGILLIFPEGNSINERKLRTIKTGTARIALGAEFQNDFKLPLTILPVGLNYSNPTRFHEEVSIQIGKPFDVKPYQQQYLDNPVEAVQDVTKLVESRLAELIVITADQKEDDLIRKIETVYKKQIDVKTLDVRLTQNIAKAVSYFQEHNPVFVREIRDKIDNYFNTIKEHKLNDYLIEKSEKIKFSKLVRYVLYFVIGFPLYVTGLIFNYIPYSIPSKIANWISSDEEYRAPIMMTSGIFTFPLYYVLMAFGFWYFFENPFIIYALIVIMPLSGFFVLQYYKRLRNIKSALAYHQIFNKEKNIHDWFREQRQEIINMLESARQQYQT